MEEIQAVEQKAVAILDQARALVVTEEREYVRAGEFIVGCKALASEIKAFFKPMKDKAFAAHRAICDQETTTLKPVTMAIEAAGSAALPWKQEQDRKAAIEAERVRQEEIKQRQEAKLKEAEMFEAFGDTKEADEVLKQAVTEPRRTKVESTVPKVAGLSTRKKWTFRFVDPDKVVRKYCEPDKQRIQFKIGGFFDFMPRATEEQIRQLQEEVGGIEVYQEEVFAGRITK